MSNNFITIPIKIRGLVLEKEQMTSSPLADFRKLPWTDGFKDFNYSQPFVGDGIIHHPFSDANLALPAGVHLHFILPHFLGQHVPENAGTKFNGRIPPAPNKWLIYNGTDTWVIESDYIHKESYVPSSTPSATIPFPSGRPYRYMGRQTKLTDSRPAGDTFKSFSGKSLTAVGYGDFKFSSFYPNCLGVFGFYDNTYVQSTTYQVVGWNDAETDDLLIESISNYLSDNDNVTSEEVQEFIKNNFNIDIGSDITSVSNYRTLYMGQVNVDNLAPAPDASDLKIGVGHTGTEAISAFVANAQSGGDSKNKISIEEQLESMLMMHKLDHLLTDTGPKFLEARHEKGFRPSHSGHLWKIISEGQSTTSDKGTTENPLPELPPDLAKALHELNKAQLDYDTASHTVVTLREQLYHDWYKYMLASYTPDGQRDDYPNPERIRYFIENYSFDELNNHIAETGLLSFNGGEQPTLQETGVIAKSVLTNWSAVNTILETENETRTTNKQPLLSMSIIPGPRYWEPNQPVVLISGLNLTPDDTFIPNDENIPQYLTSISTQSTFAPGTFDTTSSAGDIFSQFTGVALPKLSGQTWNPFILDWQVNLIDANFRNDEEAYHSNSLVDSFEINSFSPELEQGTYEVGGNSVFSGTAMMSTQSRPAMLSHLYKFITDYITKNVAHYGQNTPTTNYDLADFLKASDYAAASPMVVLKDHVPSGADAPLFVAQQAYYWLMNNKIITQALNGFNKASLMLHQVAQLPMFEPVGFEDAQLFTENATKLVQRYKYTSPIMAYDFNPIRSGELSFDQLRLIDNFGLWTDLEQSAIQDPVASDTISDDDGAPFLYPRMAQSARINFRWMSAHSVSEEENSFWDQENAAETNDHPATSPVCGWLMANYFNNSNSDVQSIAAESNILAVYDAFGTALGYLDHNAKWNLMPWGSGPCDINENIENEYLRNIVHWLMVTFTTGFSDFITATKEGLDNVAPHNQNLFNVKSILMGRPMAVVRSRVSLQTKGKHAIDQGWSSLLTDMHQFVNSDTFGYDDRNTDNWTAVKFPVRIGEHHQLNDGVVAYWPEDSNGNLMTMYTPDTTSDALSNSNINTFNGEDPQSFNISLDDEPVNLMMLMDPRGVAHATTGILPTKSISIPPEFYLTALTNLNMWFGISPLIQPQQEDLVQNLPQISGYNWQWWDRNNGTCSIVPDSDKITTELTNQIREGWLQLVPETKK